MIVLLLKRPKQREQRCVVPLPAEIHMQQTVAQKKATPISDSESMFHYRNKSNIRNKRIQNAVRSVSRYLLLRTRPHRRRDTGPA
jgi:hypothetical protein